MELIGRFLERRAATVPNQDCIRIRVSFEELRASRSTWVHIWMRSARSSDSSLCDEAIVLWQRSHMESLVPSTLATCW